MSTNPIDHADLYDAVIIAGRRSPGVVTVTGLAREWKWDVKDGDGQDGGTTTRKGKAIAQFSLEFDLVVGLDKDGRAIDEIAEWDAYAVELHRAADAEPLLALGIYHPDIERCGVRDIQIAKVHALEHTAPGRAKAKVDVLEYAPPKPKSGTAQGTQGNPGGGAAGGGAPPGAGAAGGAAGGAQDPNADAQAEIDALTQEAAQP